MDIRVAKTFPNPSRLGTVNITLAEVKNFTKNLPVDIEEEPQEFRLTFTSPIAALDFIYALEGAVEYTVDNLTPEEKLIFEDGITPTRENSIGKIRIYDRISRRWAIASFVVACSGMVIALSAFILSLVALL